MKIVPPFPDDIKTLTSLRFFAAVTVVCFHIIYFIDSYFPLKYVNGVAIHGEFPAFLQKGYMAVDFFFILSGFVLTHVYRDRIEGQKNAVKRFYLRRLARIYPLHILLLLFCGFLYSSGWTSIISSGAFLSNLFLVQAWGSSEFWARSFNGPSWSISAEWMAYLCFPVLLKMIKIFAPPKSLLITGVGMVAISLGWRLMLGHYASDQVTWCMFRILPEFLFGMALYLFLRDRSPMIAAPAILPFLVLILLVLMNIATPDIVTLFVFGAIIALAADLMRLPGKASCLTAKRWVYLGDISYSIYMIHYPLMILILGGFLNAGGLAEYDRLYPLIVLIFVVTLFMVSVASYQWIEKPLRRRIGRLMDFKEQNNPAPQ